MERLTLDDMRAIEMEITDEIDRICTEHDIAYTLAFGSLIGAIRHEGFIPWDDDMDLFMLREDYERFVHGFDQWRSSDRFELQAPAKGNATVPFAKVIDTTTLVKQTFTRESLSTGVWVDVFVLDGIDPHQHINKRAIKYLSLVRYLAVTDMDSGGNAFIRWGKKLACPLFSRLDPCQISTRMDTIAQSIAQSDSPYVADVIGRRGNTTEYVYERAWFNPLRVPFEDRTYCVPESYEEVLVKRFGPDWRTPPPESERIMHTSDVYRL